MHLQLLKEGRTVVAAARDGDRARKAFEKLGLQEGVQVRRPGAVGGMAVSTRDRIGGLRQAEAYCPGMQGPV